MVAITDRHKEIISKAIDSYGEKPFTEEQLAASDGYLHKITALTTSTMLQALEQKSKLPENFTENDLGIITRMVMEAAINGSRYYPERTLNETVFLVASYLISGGTEKLGQGSTPEIDKNAGELLNIALPNLIRDYRTGKEKLEYGPGIITLATQSTGDKTMVESTQRQ